METHDILSLRTGAWLMIAGALFFWLGAFSPPWKQWSSPLPEYLRIIHEHPFMWKWIHGWFAIGVTCTVVALLLYVRALPAGGPSMLGTSAAGLYAFGAGFWIISILFRIVIEPWGAATLVDTGSMPQGFEALHKWSSSMFGAYMILAYVATGLLGLALFHVAGIPAWTCWTVVIFGFAGAVLFPTGILLFEPPLMVHLMPLVLGIVTLVRV